LFQPHFFHLVLSAIVVAIMIRQFLTIIFFAIISGLQCYGQQFNFFNLSVNEGLIQSQVTAITQDKQGFLWISTEGGVSRYDGKKFVHFTETEGLATNTVHTMVCDLDNRIWMGTDRGISVLEGKKVTNIALSQLAPENVVVQLVSDSSGHVMALTKKGTLYEFFNLQPKRVLVGTNKPVFTVISFSPSGEFWGATRNHGIYVRSREGHWSNLGYPLKEDWFVGDIAFRRDTAILATNQGLYTWQGGEFSRFKLPLPESGPKKRITFLNCDNTGNLWIGTHDAVILLSGDLRLSIFDRRNGYTDNRTTFIFQDREGNIWLGTDGGGIFRYSGSQFSYYDERSGLINPIVMSLTAGKDRIWLGTYGSSLASLHNGKIENHCLSAPGAGVRQVTCSVLDTNGNLWIGTYNRGLWLYDGKNFQKCENNESLERRAGIGELFRDKNGRVWVATSSGFGYLKDKSIHWVKTDGVVWGFAQASDGVMLATYEGLFVVKADDQVLPATRNKIILRQQINGIFRDGQERFYLQTNGQGIFIWDKTKDFILGQIDTRAGLSSNIIYSCLRDRNGSVWVGTAYGLNRLQIGDDYKLQAITRYGKTHGMFGMESNKNALLEGSDGAIYYGTTKGLFIYRPTAIEPGSHVNEVLLREIRLHGKLLNDTSQGKLAAGYFPPPSLKLNYLQNHLSFEFLAVHFRSADNIEYQYYLEGAEKEWSAPHPNTSVTYSSLAPGEYIFHVRARADNSAWSKELKYSFFIETPFFRTVLFRSGVVLGLVLIGVGIHRARTKNKLRRQKKLYAIRIEEQSKVRQKTAEDFHDEMGNKLTRITLLTDILKSKLGDQNTELTKLVIQIKDNSLQLYSGTKDIIWSLKPKSDNLYEILQRVRDVGTETFQDTHVEFIFSGLSEEITTVILPIDYSRNLIMIFKEAFNNVLRHADSTRVCLTLQKNGNEVLIELTDNGKGLDIEKIKKGHGIANMKLRAARINGLFSFQSEPGKGTSIELRLKIPHEA
jgi:signal transduction histidine kinase/ligand-binding sensor domain-containing protein